MSWDDGDSGFGAEDNSANHLMAVLLDPVGVANRRWLPMVLCAALGLIVTAVAVVVWEPTYRGAATVLITSQEIPTDFVRSTVRDDTIANIDALMGQVLSLENASRLIEETGLFPDAGETAKAALVSRVRNNVDAGPVSRPSRGAESIVYELAYEAPDPREAAKVANALAALFIEANTASRNALARKATEFLRQALADDEEELRTLASEISAFRQANRGELPDELQSNLRKLEGLNSQISSLNQQIAIKEDRILALTTHGGDTVMSENEVLLGELRRAYARETAAHTDEHPNVIALRERIARLEQMVGEGGEMSRGTQLILSTERRDIERLKALRSDAELEAAQVNQRIDNTPVVADRLNAMLQREQVLREDYLSSLRKVEDAELAENLESAQQGGQVSMLDPAVTPRSPEVPRWLLALAGLAASIALSLAVALLLELVDPVVLSAAQIEKESGSPVLGSLPIVG